ncbi:MAG: hypothetical protein Q9201_005136 [Fulgogasparrea decipioides]
MAVWIRFRGIYYPDEEFEQPVVPNNNTDDEYDSVPDTEPHTFRRRLASKIPADQYSYTEWLEPKRYSALQLHNARQDMLSRTTDEWYGLDTDPLPDFKPSTKYLVGEWEYIIDLDHELLTINGGFHIPLLQVQHVDYPAALVHDDHDNGVALPEFLPKDAVASPALKQPPNDGTSGRFQQARLNDLNDVRVKRVNNLSLKQQIGPLFRLKLFKIVYRHWSRYLSATLRTWQHTDFYFREHVFALLCIASSSRHQSFIPDTHVRDHHGYHTLVDKDERHTEFFTHLGVGAHIRGVDPGSSPASDIYWFDGALICLAERLGDWPEVVDRARISVMEFYRSNGLDHPVDVVIISIEHIILMKIHSDARVRSTEVMPLFEFPVHSSMAATVRYPSNHLTLLHERKHAAIAKSRLSEQQLDEHHGTSNENWVEQEGIYMKSPGRISETLCTFESTTGTENTFLTLVHALENSHRREIPRSSSTGVFSVEILRMILWNVTDSSTWYAWLEVSWLFRDLGQELFIPVDGMILQKHRKSATKHSRPATKHSKSKHKNPATNNLCMEMVSPYRSKDAKLENVARLAPNNLPEFLRSYYSGKPNIIAPTGDKADWKWHVVVGKEYNRRSVIPDLRVGFREGVCP